VDRPRVKLDGFVPQYDGDELANGGDFPVKHVAACTGTHDDGDHLLLRASSADGTNTLWPLRKFAGYDRYRRIYAVRRLRREFRRPARASGGTLWAAENLSRTSQLTTYIEMRRVAEDRLRRRFTDLGGRPERRAPHYFVLGESPWFRGLAADMEEIRVPLGCLPSAQTTVTWGDSFAAMEVTRDFGLAFTSKPYYGRLYRLADIVGLAARYGIPKPAPEGYEALAAADTPETFIEIQLWSDEPVRRYFPPCQQVLPAASPLIAAPLARRGRARRAHR